MDVFLLDDLNNTKDQIKIIKPKNYKHLKIHNKYIQLHLYVLYIYYLIEQKTHS